MSIKVFVDGSAGTTGLQINERLKKHGNVEILSIPNELRKCALTRRKYLNEADIAFLCLPDNASREAVSMISGSTRVIDTSTAFRTNERFVYGFPELDKNQRDKIKNSDRITVPGCHATGFTASVHPLIFGGIIAADYPLCCQSITGYSGGGKSLIAKYKQNRLNSISLKSPRFYALDLTHKHLPEMQKINSLSSPPLFTPIVADFYNGMLVSLPLSRSLLSKKLDAKEIHAYYEEYYKDELFVKVLPFGAKEYLDEGFLDATKCNETNMLEIIVFGHGDQILVISRLDNLGKGASGAAIQCMNIMAGFEENMGLT